MNIRAKFLLMFLIVAILPLVILTTYILQSSQKALSQKAEDHIQAVATLKEAETRAAIASYRDQIMFIAKRTTLISQLTEYDKTGDSAVANRIDQLLTLVEQVPQNVRTVSVFTRKGQVIASSDQKMIGQTRDTSQKPVVFVQVDDQSPSITLTQPVMNGATTVGYVEFIEQAPQVDSIAQDYTGLGETGDALFIKLSGDDHLAHSRGRVIEGGLTHDELEKQLAMPALISAFKARSVESFVVESGDISFLAVMRHMEDLDTALLVKEDTAEAFKAVDELRDGVLVFSLIFSLIIIMVILLFVHSITSPIANLAEVAKKITNGNLDERALVLSNDEIGNLATTLNYMLDDLQASKETLEKKVHERTQQLEATNKELESFSYSVSHDLRAPLRAIDGFSKILVEDYGKKVDSEGMRIIQTIINSTQQMGRLIDDLLAFSRLGRQAVKKQPVDMEVLVKEVFEEQQRINEGRKLNLKIKDLPVAAADASLIRQVLVNLISNAIKFTRNRDVGIIEVGAQPHRDAVTYYVKDNGAGFDMAFIDKLFGVFQRLHDQKDFEGTGVGLAIVKRIITLHGGSVWAEGKVGFGATIYFSLPKVHKPRTHHE